MDYIDLLLKAGFVDYGPTKGSMVIKPYGYSLWESIQNYLNKRFTETGHQNLAFPSLIPQSFFQKEASHVSGFAKECFVVTHTRLKSENNTIKLDPDSALEEPYILRPTSETIIWSTYKNWIQSYRDLPLKYNQWCNVFRAEMRPRLFLRTSEFLWQEGHTAHVTKEEAQEEVQTMLNIYQDLCEQVLALSPLIGPKSFNETFAGAEYTLTLESLTYEKKALQLGTSHFLGQSFSKAFNVLYKDKEGLFKHPYCTSWGVSTRLIGALTSTHLDEKGFIMPPEIAPIQIVLIPIYKGESKSLLEKSLIDLNNLLQKKGFRTHLDLDENKSPGWKFAEYELKGVPLRVVLGPKDLEKNQLEVHFRLGNKEIFSRDLFLNQVDLLLKNMQEELYKKALQFRQENTFKVVSEKEFNGFITEGGFVLAPWDGTLVTAELVQKKYKATIRCLAKEKIEQEKDPFSKDQAQHWVYYARSY